MHLTGFHHLTAITADAAANYAFYTGVLGLRLVKKTVNQDDVSAYHLFYADAVGSPGSDVTFFEWPVGPEKRGSNSITRIGLRVASESNLHWWLDRFDTQGLRHGPVERQDGRAILDFESPEGQRLRLVEDGGQGPSHPWQDSPVPPEHQIRGLGMVIASVPRLEPTDGVLRQALEMRAVRSYESEAGVVRVYAMGPGDTPDTELHLVVEPGLPQAQPGAGAVHHVALRTPDADSHLAWAERLASLRIPCSGQIDRYYFRSLYFREPNGILFEIATDGPGFATDEPLDRLGEALSLPPFLESRRDSIAAGLKPLLSGR